MFTDHSDSGREFFSLDEMNDLDDLINQIERESPDTLRLLASGMLSYLECRLGGHCFCGKPIEEREIASESSTLVESLELCQRHFAKSSKEDRERVINQIRDQWPAGLLIADEVVQEGVPAEGTETSLVIAAR